MSRTIDTEQLRSFFEDRPNCDLVYLFGSTSEGSVRDGSDLDLAILFDEKPDIMELAGLRADLQTLLHFEEIDIAVLNDASPILRFEALQGKRIYSRDRGQEAIFASLTAREYEDARAMVEKARSYD